MDPTTTCELSMAYGVLPSELAPPLPPATRLLERLKGLGWELIAFMLSFDFRMLMIKDMSRIQYIIINVKSSNLGAPTLLFVSLSGPQPLGRPMLFDQNDHGAPRSPPRLRAPARAAFERLGLGWEWRERGAGGHEWQRGLGGAAKCEGSLDW